MGLLTLFKSSAGATTHDRAASLDAVANIQVAGEGPPTGPPGMPSLRVEADFTTPALVVPIDWTDLSGRVRALSIQQGRQRLLARTEAGRATVVLDNRDRALDPTTDPDIRPLNHLRIKAVHNGEEYPLFQGFVTAWPQEWPAGGVDAVSRVEAEDAFSLMARYELEGEEITERLSGAHIEAVLDTFGWPATNSVPPGETWWLLGDAGSELGNNTFLGESLTALEPGNVTIMTLNLEGNLLNHLLNVAETTEGGTFYVANDGSLVFQEAVSVVELPVATWGDEDGEFRYVDIRASYNDEQIYNDVRLTRRGDSTPSTATDASSIDTYGPRTLSISDTLYSTVAAQDAAATGLVSKHRDPHLHFTSLTMRPKPDSPVWPYILTARQGTKIRVLRRPPGGGEMIEIDCIILGITREVTPQYWEVTWALAPTTTVVEFWELGTVGLSELGETTYLGA